MKFNEWVNESRGRALLVAKTVGVSPPVVSDWVTGKKSIPAAHAKAIFRLSEGAVTCQEMRPTDWRKYWPELDEVAACLCSHSGPAQFQPCTQGA